MEIMFSLPSSSDDAGLVVDLNSREEGAVDNSGQSLLLNTLEML